MTGTLKARQVADACAQADPHSAIEHFVVCPICGQIFDCRETEQVRHHTQAQHQPQSAAHT
jgi:hypothetical protein